MYNRLLYVLLTLLSPFTGAAQESLEDLQYNQALRATYGKTPASASRNEERRPFVYVIDTLSLPFVDDFSRNKIKQYHATETDPNITIKVHFGFTVNGEHPETLSILFDTTYSTTKLLTGETITSANPTLYITYYNDGKPVSYDTAWTNIITQMDQGLGLVTYDTLEAETTLINTFDTLYYVADDGSLWVTPADEAGRGGPYINNTFAISPLTQGVATFDGTDAFGVPYDISSETIYGSADTLESKPLYLDSNMEEIFVSFFYQQGGNGNTPDETDSLVLEFFNVRDSLWEYAWSAPGNAARAEEWSEQVFKRIKGPKFQRPGFRFRFRNYATLSGSFDHWHIDYVRLDNDRDSLAEDTLYDVSFVTPLSSFTGEYTSVPYTHYLAAPLTLQSAEVSTTIRNLSPVDVFVSAFNYTIQDPSGNVIQSVTTTVPNLPAETLGEFIFTQPTTAIFPDIGEEFATFNITGRYSVTGNNDLYINDTIRSQQVFRNHYAYDDGSAEKAYALTGAGLQLAYEFKSAIGDTLKAILFNFPKTLHDQNKELSIKLMVWKNLGQAPVYTSVDLINPEYTNANEFVRYNLEEPLYVEGTFYIGFQQTERDKIYIGYDVNTVSNEKLFYKISNTWYTSSISGSLMMRADFGDEPSTVSTGEPPAITHEMKLYPNPAQNEVFFSTTTTDPVTMSVFSLSGTLVTQQQVLNNERVDTGRLAAGIYLVELRNTTTGQAETLKLIVTH